MGCDEYFGGPGLTEEESLRILEKRRQELKSSWEIGLRMAVAYPHSRDEYSCPECFAKVERCFLTPHDKWHKMLPIRNMMGMLF